MGQRIIPQNLLTAALAFALGDTTGYPEGCNAHIFPDGAFRAEDGRPACVTNGEVRDWQMSAEIAAQVIAAMEAAGKPILYDYEHNSNWGDSRAAGWIDKLVYVAGKGLFGHVDWTPDAAEAIARKEYRYSSPYFLFNGQTGAVVRLLSVALTNVPALGELGAVELARRAALAGKVFSPAGGLPGNPSGDPDMSAEQLAALAKENGDLKTQSVALATENAGLKTQLAALTADHDKLKAEQVAAALAAEKTRHAELLDAALNDGRLTPAQKAWAEKQPLAALTEYLDATGPLPMTQTQTDGKPGTTAALTADEKAMCERMGVTPEAFLAAKGK